MLIEDLERFVLAERQVAAVIQASGRYKESPLPSLAETRQKFEDSLSAEPKTAPTGIDLEQLELRQALGVA